MNEPHYTLTGIFFLEGRAAASDGIPREANPYDNRFARERQGWFDGWDDVAAERATSDSHDN